MKDIEEIIKDLNLSSDFKKAYSRAIKKGTENKLKQTKLNTVKSEVNLFLKQKDVIKNIYSNSSGDKYRTIANFILYNFDNISKSEIKILLLKNFYFSKWLKISFIFFLFDILFSIFLVLTDNIIFLVFTIVCTLFTIATYTDSEEVKWK